jgi:hypothetical protein
MAYDTDVCADRWPARKDDRFVWVNPNPNAVTVSKSVIHDWPFTKPSPIHIPGKSANGHPGRKECAIPPNLDPGTYTYNVAGCGNEVGPKTVIIT